MRAGDFSALCTTGFTAGVCNTASQQLTNPATHLPFLNNNIASALNQQFAGPDERHGAFAELRITVGGQHELY